MSGRLLTKYSADHLVMQIPGKNVVLTLGIIAVETQATWRGCACVELLSFHVLDEPPGETLELRNIAQSSSKDASQD
jgi:hypothetical protein